jgi:hypothetical protein
MGGIIERRVTSGDEITRLVIEDIQLLSWGMEHNVRGPIGLRGDLAGFVGKASLEVGTGLAPGFAARLGCIF